MSTIINADTSGGLKLTSDTSGQLELQSAGSTKVTMDTSGNVGIEKDTLLSFYPADQSYANIKFEWDTGDAGYLHSTAFNGMKWTTNGSERMRIDSSGNLKFNSGYGSVATAYGCRAWVNFNGTGTVAIRDSGNVSSITDSGVGIYLVNFTTNMPDINYSVSLVSGSNMNNTTLHNTLVLTSSYRIHNLNDAGSYADASLIMSQVVR